KVTTPYELKKLDKKQLPQLEDEIRNFLIESVAETGGHLASNLGVVELTIALHYVYDSPKDKLIWDVGHQGYVHKILTGRANKFDTLRQYKGISGFLKRHESEHDIFGAGHASTSLSAATGIAIGRDALHEKYNVVAIIGDGSFSGGMALEALNNIIEYSTNLTIVINDNKMSISPNLGAYKHYFSKIINGEEDIENTIFKKLGYDYYGPIDGHNVELLIDTFNKLKNKDGIKIVHVLTEKGKGYKYSEEDKVKFHGIPRFRVSNGEKISPKNEDNLPTYTAIFANTLIKIAKNNKKIRAITAGMPTGTGVAKFAEKYPDLCIDVGICEQHAVTLAAGLSIIGIKPIVAIYSTFLQRAYDQLIHDVCLQDLPVVFALDRAGLVGADGPTHHGTFDLSYLNLVPNLVIMAPKDGNEMQHMINTAVNFYDGPIAIRYPRGKINNGDMDEELKNIPIGKAEFIEKGKDIVLVAIGNMVKEIEKAALTLKNEGISCSVINARFSKPIDKQIIEEIREIKKAIIVEEGSMIGGFGSSVLVELSKENIKADVKLIAIPDEFIEQGTQEQLRKQVGLTSENIVKNAHKLID
ncbi:MAG: 1-deoxy-D-xylulose-5-phosphate synthase, partial [Candidatus Heimdallarchaeaceae archaeon]